jgi:cytochrome d ubiquinol oxidase subunit II
MGGLDGHQLTAAADRFGDSNPLHKGVALVHGGWLANYRAHAVLWVLPVGAVLAAGATWRLLGLRRCGAAFVSSALTLGATILTAGVALFPFLMPSSTHPNQGLTVWDASSSRRTLGIMLVAVVILLPIVLAYTAWVFRVLRGRITLEEIRRHTGIY